MGRSDVPRAHQPAPSLSISNASRGSAPATAGAGPSTALGRPGALDALRLRLDPRLARRGPSASATEGLDASATSVEQLISHDPRDDTAKSLGAEEECASSASLPPHSPPPPLARRRRRRLGPGLLLRLALGGVGGPGGGGGRRRADETQKRPALPCAPRGRYGASPSTRPAAGGGRPGGVSGAGGPTGAGLDGPRRARGVWRSRSSPPAAPRPPRPPPPPPRALSSEAPSTWAAGATRRRSSYTSPRATGTASWRTSREWPTGSSARTCCHSGSTPRPVCPLLSAEVRPHARTRPLPPWAPLTRRAGTRGLNRARRRRRDRATRVEGGRRLFLHL